MTTLSKIAFKYLATENIKCSDVLHPETDSCFLSVLKNIISFPIGNARFFFPLFLIRILMNLKNMSPEVAYGLVKHYLDTIYTGAFYALGCTTSVCLMRKILGKFTLSSTILIPNIISTSIIINFVPMHTVKMMNITIFEGIIEVLLRFKMDPFSKLIANSKFARIFVFMLCSSYIIQNLPKQKSKIFWFIMPKHKKSQPKDSSKKNLDFEGESSKSIDENSSKDESETQQMSNGRCAMNHKGSCKAFITDGLKFYGIVGVVLDLAKQILSSKSIKHFIKIFKKRAVTFDYEATKFLVSYIVAFRGINCFLNQFNMFGSSSIHNMIAGFLSGCSYVFYPKIIFMSYAVLCCVQITWNNFKNKKNHSEFEKWFKNLSWDKIFGALAIPFTIHLFIFNHEDLGNIGRRFVNGSTNNKAGEARDNLIKIMSKYY